jgi:NAD(P)H dehydrogenase (quinone)
VASELISHGFPIRAFVHSRDARSDSLNAIGAEVFEGDLLDAAAIRVALKGVDRAYFCFPPADGLLEATTSFAIAARDVGVGRVVNVSQYHARQAHPSGLTRQHWLAEHVLDFSGIPTIHLRSNFFMDVYLLVCGETIAKMNKFILPHGDAAWAPIATADVARVAAALLINPSLPEERVIKLTGPEKLTQAQAARTMSTTLGRPIEYVSVSIDEWRVAAKQMGLSNFLLDHLCHAADDIKAGNFAVVTDEVRKITGNAPQSLRSFLEENSMALSK